MGFEKLRFGDVAHAINTTPKSLRNWLQRGQVSLKSSTPEEGGWREFDPADIPHLALVRTLVTFGLEVRQADKLVSGILEGLADPVFRIDADGDWRVLDYEVAIWPIDDGNDWQCFPFDGGSESEKAISQSPATLILRVGRIIALAMQRALNRLDGEE